MKQPPSLWISSLLSLGSVLLLLLLAVSTTKPPQDGTHNRLPRRSLQEESKFYNLSSTRECRNYVMPFFQNNTFDEQDECKALHNAYETAHCPNDTDAATGIITDDLVLEWRQVNADCCANMERFYLRYCEYPAEDVTTMILDIIGILLLCAMAQAGLHSVSALHWIPDACAFILIGAAISAIMAQVHHHEMVYDRFYFDEDFFLQILLPPTIFQAALSIDKPSFGRHVGPILLFALVGTAMSAVSIGIMTHYWYPTLPLLESLVFGALISSVDPVATLGILSGVGVDPSGTLYAMIAGESLLNDAVAIVLFDTLQQHLGDDDAILGDLSTYQEMMGHFVTVSVGSMVVALVLGVCSVLFFWMLQGQQVAVAEVGSFIAWALIPYYVAEAWDLSGIIAILTMGFIMDFYILGCHSDDHGHPPPIISQHGTLADIMSGRGLLSPECCLHIGFISHAIAATMETIIFAYLGLFLFDDKVYSMALDQVAVWSCVISRGGMVLLLSWVVNTVKMPLSCVRHQSNNNDATAVLLDPKTQLMIFLAGIRGAVSFALVAKIPVYDVIEEKGTKFKAELKAMTSTAIIFTLFVFGALAYFTVDRPSPPLTSAANDEMKVNKGSEDVLSPLTESIPESRGKYGATDDAAKPT
ncbi:Sodium/hydrogen exchanger [Seminavis robusta]|uniref:Sodium/hydrogen exchanger n=1 Tax=Seminavis robusta TaxID=568900 RepID=A0A9N8DLY4_9STRA|nr:Sodium/hydrogen exchanger [Seminavis robusta]|eukprot:Sro230_g093450.1 Sodium/hydrogen exchanger (643) ;mRNA; f:73936-75864